MPAEAPFDLAETDRMPNRHVAFGVGIHRCPGSHLARLEFTEMIDGVLHRLPGYVLGEVREYPDWAAIGGRAEIPVTVPGGPAASLTSTSVSPGPRRHRHEPSERQGDQ